MYLHSRCSLTCESRDKPAAYTGVGIRSGIFVTAWKQSEKWLINQLVIIKLQAGRHSLVINPQIIIIVWIFDTSSNKVCMLCCCEVDSKHVAADFRFPGL